MALNRPFSYLLYILVGLLAFSCVQEFPATVPFTRPQPPANSGPPKEQPAPPKRLFIANDKVRLAIDLNMGGAINYLSEAGSNVNMINNVDLGRQLQTALYGGPYPYSVNGKDPVEQWKYLGWNPVQTGDYFNHPARIVSYQQNQNLLYVKTIPLIWPLFDEPADCVMEHWIELKGNTVHVRSRTTVNRTDTTKYEARTQETPCVYLNAPWYRMVTYTGMQPFTNGAVSEFTDRDMITRYATENWIALLNDQGRGVGLYKAGEFRYRTAFFGNSRAGNEFDEASSYMNSDGFIQIDHNGQYEFEYTLVVGSLTDIRQYAYNQPRPATAPNYRFVNDRQNWYYTNTYDQGWPIPNELNISWQRVDTTKANFRVSSPLVFWRTADIPKIYVQAAFKTQATIARIVWRKPEEIDFYDIPGRYVDFPIIGDGQYRVYEINLAGQPGWEGVVNQICLLNPPSQNRFEKGSLMRLKSVTATRP
ncbi:hypothetical protein HNV11_01465 [Spirosoma taeanense]|uniref:Uncharacterized protein n=1 Tax=Spirosoma taeanense TaxID=2735870 RepID=A0A6M5Y2W1_9BACT|nr:hypothetical protein [Spirosoma taeanense]QJW88139.1 hypothetical protein HNV11_01465 [Spirosoma taeanense]